MLIFKQIQIHDAATIPYKNQDGMIKSNTVRTHEKFHGHKCKDSVIWKANEGLAYSKLTMMFKISVYTKEYDIAYVQDSTMVPLSLQSDNDKATGFQQITLGGMDSVRFILPSSFVFVHHAFIVNTDDIHLNHYFVNDLINLDMYLHINQQG